MREISSRLERCLGRGALAYLAARLSEFYERAGLADALRRNDRYPLSEPLPPGGLRAGHPEYAAYRESILARCSFPQRRHFPAINWLNPTAYLDTMTGHDKEYHPSGMCYVLGHGSPVKEVELRDRPAGRI